MKRGHDATMGGSGETLPDVFFVHVMKTGGMSISRLLRDLYDPRATYPDLGEDHALGVKIYLDPILALDEEQRRAIRCYSVHMPAWVAEHVAPSHTTVTVLREPVARTISHLRHIARVEFTPDDLEEIYDDPSWRDRLGNYQTRLFAPSKTDHDQHREAARRFVEQADDEARRQLMAEMEKVWMTGIDTPGPVGESALDRAIARLDGFDEVGVTEGLDRFVGRLGRRLGRELPRVPHVNASALDAAVPTSLERRIRHDNELDLAFYEHAARRAGAPG